MVHVGGVGKGVVGGLEDVLQTNIPNQLPRIFSKVTARYAPLILPSIMHDLPENYMKSLPKFMGQWDLTTKKHISFFDQFVDILRVEHEDVNMILLV